MQNPEQAEQSQRMIAAVTDYLVALERFDREALKVVDAAAKDSIRRVRARSRQAAFHRSLNLW